MGNRLGIIAGSGETPHFIFHKAEEMGYTCFVAGIRGEAADSLSRSIQPFRWFDIVQIEDVINYFKQENIHEVVFAGKIDHRKIYSGQNSINALIDLIHPLRDLSPSSLIFLAIEFLSMQGITVKDPTEFLSSTLLDEGNVSKTRPTPQIQEDIDFGWGKARVLADLDIGQTLVVKNKAVVAVEGMEGTDAAIRRGGQLAGPGAVAIKISRTHQDPRVDFPAVGLSTVQSLVDAGFAALCLEAGKVAFFQKEKSLSLADAKSLVILARSSAQGSTG
jgi:DUF1009 family protein